MKNNEPENFRTDQKDHAAEGLPGISSDRRTLHGCIGRFRHAVVRCGKNRCWSEEMCEICGVHKEQLAKVYESYESSRHAAPRSRSRTSGLPETVKVAAGAGDNAAAAVGTGTVGDGQVQHFPRNQRNDLYLLRAVLQWIRIMRSMPLPMRTDITI